MGKPCVRRMHGERKDERRDGFRVTDDVRVIGLRKHNDIIYREMACVMGDNNENRREEHAMIEKRWRKRSIIQRCHLRRRELQLIVKGIGP